MENFLKEYKKKIQNNFKDLIFEESSHSYYLNKNKIKYSVSGLIKQFVENFDSKGLSQGVARKRGISSEQVLAEWKQIADEACSLGTSVHLFGENYTFNRELKPSNGYEEAIVKFFKSLPNHIIPVITELQMYHKTFLFAGTCDTLLYNTKTNKFILTDYKTNKDLFKNFNFKKMIGVFSDLLDTPYNKYQLQLSYYQILFEQTGFEIEKRRIIWLRPDSTYTMYDTDDYTEKLNILLNNGTKTNN